MTEEIPCGVPETVENPESEEIENPPIENLLRQPDTDTKLATCSDTDDSMAEINPASNTTNDPPNAKLTNSTPDIYKPPIWAQSCPPDLVYQLEVIKNGIPLTDCMVNLGSIGSDSMACSFCLFGRMPESYYGPYNDLLGQCITLAHPSISRLHAVLQFGRPPLSIAKTSASQPDLPGWYLQDLGSTHGTFVNKRRLPPGRFVRIHVGYVIRFGGSARLHILQGPEADTERESAQTWSELKQAKQERLNKQLQDPKQPGTPPHMTQTVELGCDWGISLDDQIEESKPVSFLDSAACLSHEKLYRDDPKRALNAYFEREGIDPVPQYEFVEAPFGKQHCRIELPLASGTVTAEAIVAGKRKEATAACALEACRLLDRLGEFDPDKDRLSSTSRMRSQAYWEENDYYSSDEDTFVDRTGRVEQKRLERIRHLGIQGPVAEEAQRIVEELAGDKKKSDRDTKLKQNATMLGILSQLEKVGEEIIAVEERLAEIDREFNPTGSNPSELDELEAYMNALKAGSETRKERSKLKSRLFQLRQNEMRLFHQAKLPQLKHRASALRPSGRLDTTDSLTVGSDAAAAVRAAKHKLNVMKTEEAPVSEQVPKSARATRDAIKRSLTDHRLPRTSNTDHKHKIEEVFVAEEDDDDEEEEEDAKNAANKPERLDKSRKEDTLRKSEPDQVRSTTSQVVENSKPTSFPAQHVDEHLAKITDPGSRDDQSARDLVPAAILDVNTKDSSTIVPEDLSAMESMQIDQDVSEIPDTDEQSLPDPNKPQSNNKSYYKPSKVDIYAGDDPDYVVWVPPTDQDGDGITALNAKYGY